MTNVEKHDKLLSILDLINELGSEHPELEKCRKHVMDALARSRSYNE